MLTRSIRPFISSLPRKFSARALSFNVAQLKTSNNGVLDKQHEVLLNTVHGSSRRGMVTITKTAATDPKIEFTQETAPTDSPGVSSSSPVLAIQDNDSVKITPSAVRQIHRLATQKRPDDPANAFLRVYVDAGGCSGFQYKFELEDKDDEENPIDPDEYVIIQTTLSDGSLTSTIVIDEGSLEYIKGSTIDFVREMIRSSFAVVENPLSESACGCGSSFALKNFESNPALD